MAWIAPLIAAGSSLLGGLLGNSKSARTGTSSSSGTSSSTITPVGDPRYTELGDTMIQQVLTQLQQGSQLPAGYESLGINNINDVYRLTQQKNENDLTRRGLSTSPVSGVVSSNTNMGRAGQISDFENALPLIERQMQQENLNSALNVYNTQRYGQTQTGTSSQTGTTTNPGSAAAGGLGSLGTMLAYLYGNGAFGGNSNTNTATLGGGTNRIGWDW
jgi:hypothetical protein